MEIVLTRDPTEFAALAQEFLAARIERNILATVLANSLVTQVGTDPPLFAAERTTAPTTTTATTPATATATATTTTVSAAIRTPPWQMLAIGWEQPGSADRLLDAWLELDPELPGVSSQPATAAAIGAAWTRRTGGQIETEFAEAMHVLRTVTDPPHPAPGRLRPATRDDRPLLVQWELGFIDDAGVGHRKLAEPTVDRRLANQRQMIWDDAHGTPVSTVGFNRTIAGITRIGPVYTPPELRGRGYASMAVAELSRQLLATGSEQCMLMTDLANPTSNKIYAAIGYRRCADWGQHRFVTPAA